MDNQQQQSITRIEGIPKKPSSLIVKIEYSFFFFNKKRTNELITIWFIDKSQIEYHNFGEPLDFIFEELKTCESIGKYWHKNIKNKLHYKKIR